MIYLGAVVEEAEDVTKAHIEYWSHTLDVLANLQKTGQDWLEDPWSAKRALAQWKIVLQKYGECSHMVGWNTVYRDNSYWLTCFK